MFKPFLLLLCLFSVPKIYSQVTAPYPNSVIDLSFGAGPQHGIIGGKAVLGYKGTGLVLGLGTFEGITGYYVGLQASARFIYVTLGRGVVGTSTDGNTNATSPIIGNCLMVGTKLNLSRNKRFYLELGVGFQESSINGRFGSINTSGTIYSLGFGYRISFWKPKTKE